MYDLRTGFADGGRGDIIIVCYREKGTSDRSKKKRCINSGKREKGGAGKLRGGGFCFVQTQGALVRRRSSGERVML